MSINWKYVGLSAVGVAAIGAVTLALSPRPEPWQGVERVKSVLQTPVVPASWLAEPRTYPIPNTLAGYNWGTRLLNWILGGD